MDTALAHILERMGEAVWDHIDHLLFTSLRRGGLELRTQRIDEAHDSRGDRIFVNRLAYDLKVPFTTWHVLQWGDPQRGDIVVLYSPADGKLLVKRVIGLPGDTIELRDNQLFVNDSPAQYEPLEDEFANEVSPDERTVHDFAREHLGDQSHPVMTAITRWGASSFEATPVPANMYFVMGDNRDNSSDSRYFGCVERRAILGRATATAISVDPQNYYMPRWHRFFRSLP